MATRAPLAIKVSAMPRPIPELPPVTSATAFFRCISKSVYREQPLDDSRGSDTYYRSGHTDFIGTKIEARLPVEAVGPRHPAVACRPPSHVGHGASGSAIYQSTHHRR